MIFMNNSQEILQVYNLDQSNSKVIFKVNKTHLTESMAREFNIFWEILPFLQKYAKKH